MINPEQYEACDLMTERDAAVFLPKAYLFMEWSQGVNVLDYGCGPGRRAIAHVLPQVEKFHGQLYSVDISKDMVEYAKKNYPHPMIHYATGDIVEKFPFNHVKFDNILSFYVLHFIQDIRSALGGFNRILKDGGHFGFMALTAKSISTRALKEIAQRNQWKGYMKGYEQFMVNWSEYPEGSDAHKKNQHFASILNKCGFHVKHLQVLERAYSYDDIELFLEICLVVNPFLAKVPKKLHQQLKEDYRAVVTGIVGVATNSQCITITHEHIFAVVQKCSALPGMQPE